MQEAGEAEGIGAADENYLRSCFLNLEDQMTDDFWTEYHLALQLLQDIGATIRFRKSGQPYSCNIIQL